MKKILFALTLLGLSGIPVWAQMNNLGAVLKIAGGTTLAALAGIENASSGALIVDGTLRTAGDLTNSTGATLQGDGQYLVGGDWTNTATFNAGTSTATFQGDQSSTVASGGAAFYNLTLNKTGSNNNLLLADPMDVANTFDFQAANNYVSLGDFNLQVGNMLGYDATRYVRTTGAGFLLRTVGASPVVFPVGNSAYNPATLTNAGVADQYFLRVADAVLSSGDSGSPLTADAVNRSWFVQEGTPGGSDLSVMLQWNGSEEQTSFDRSMAYLSHFTAGSWDMQPASASAGGDPYTLSRSGITNLSPFAVLDGDFLPVIDINGIILWEHDTVSGVKNVNVTLSGDDTDTDLTELDGSYALSAVAGSNFTLTPSKNINKLNGITIADALAIQQHIANLNLITNPYKQVAADVNESNSITTLDATIIKQALLGNPAALPQIKTSWRFVPKDYTMPSPPWGFPEQIDLTGMTTNQTNQDFYGIKIGDVTASFADPANFKGGSSDGNMEPLVWRVQDQMLVAGQDIQVTFAADFQENIAAFQFGLHFDPQYLQLEDVDQLAALPLGDEHFGLFDAQLGAIRAAWAHHEGFSLPHGAEVFKIHFKVLKSGVTLSTVLGLDETLLPGLAFNNLLEHNTVQLYFAPLTATNTPKKEASLLENWPNPFVQSTNLRFYLPEACRAEIRVLDESGRELWRKEKMFPAGNTVEQLKLDGISTTGVLVCMLITPYGTRQISLLRIEN